MGHFVDVDDQGSDHDDHGGGEDALDEGTGEYTGVFGAGRAGHYRGVDGFNAEGLSRRTVH